MSAHLGRRIGEIDLPIRAPDLESWISRSTREAVLVEAEIQDRSDRWHRLQVRPRRAADGRADGVILSLVDIDDLRHPAGEFPSARDQATRVEEVSP
jgi:hypothetical protein